MAHPDARVRREAIPLVLRNPEGRERVLALALAEADERSVRLALLQLRADLPEVLVPVVVNRVIRSDWSPEIRALAARALANSRSALALDTLIGLCTDRSIFGKLRLAARAPDVIAGLQALALSWADEDRAAEVLELAADSSDPDIRQAVGVRP